MKKYFVPVLFENGYECLIGTDGLIYKISTDQANELLKDYPHDEEGWYFNESKDRLCAEIDYDGVIVNPSIMSKEIGEILTIQY